MEILRDARPYEDIYFEDPEENPGTPRFRVWFDDRSIEAMLGKVATAIDRAQSINRKLEGAQTEEERAEQAKAMANLEKRVIAAFIGTDGYEQLLAWMGDGEPVDPMLHTSMLGEVMASFLSLLGRKATNQQLRACGLLYAREGAKTKAFLQEQRKAKSGAKKKSRK